VNISKPKKICEAISYNIVSRNKDYCITTLSYDKRISISNLDQTNDTFVINDTVNIYKYEKADTVNYLETFFINSRFYVIHLEKFSYEIIMSFFTDPRNVTNNKLGDTNMKPFIYVLDDNLNYIFYDINKKALLLDVLNLHTFKKNEFIGEKKIIFFDGYFDRVKNNLLVMWQVEKENNNYYLSIMEKELISYTPINMIKFNQKINNPLIILSDSYFNMLFTIDYNNYYFRYPYSNDIRDYAQIKFPFEFQTYNLNTFFNINDIYVIVFKKSIENYNGDEFDIVEIVFYDKDFNYSLSSKISKIDGVTSDFCVKFINNNLFIFWIESLNNKKFLYFSKINIEKKR